MKTFSANSATVTRSWYIVDAKGRTLGRMASRVAAILRGKHKPEYTPHVDTGDYVIVINAAQAKVTGRKTEQKKYYRHTEYPGGIKEMTYAELISKKPEKAVEFAVKGMLPRNPLGRVMFKKLKVYAGAEHPHTAQQAELLEDIA
jgi:large subunit ribosomal protein L13